MGGIFITVLKEREYLHVEIENPEYGDVEFVHDISKYLDNSMMVSITWKKNVCKLYQSGC